MGSSWGARGELKGSFLGAFRKIGVRSLEARLEFIESLLGAHWEFHVSILTLIYLSVSWAP